MKWFLVALAFVLCSATARAEAPAADAAEILEKVLDSDPWGLGGAAVQANVILTDKRGTTRELSFTAISKRYDPPLSKSVVRFSSPPDLAGAGFLQIQRREGDDARYLFLPALKRVRRISGSLRSSAFMGTDFSFADLDRRDLRDGRATKLGMEKVGASACYVVDVIPQRSDTEYSHLELWVRTGTFLPLRMKMYDKANVLIKTFEAREVRRVTPTSTAWYVSKSLMTDHRHGHSTLLTLQSFVANAQIPDEEFSVGALERP